MQDKKSKVSRETSWREKLDARRLRLFLAISFGLSWGLGSYLSRNGGLVDSPVIFEGLGLTLAQVVIAIGYMWAPALATIITRIATKEGWKDSLLPLKFKEGRPYWLAAWFLPGLLTIIGALIYFLFTPGTFDPALGRLQALVQSAAQSAGQLPELSLGTIALIQGLQAILIAPLINSFFTFGEEFGWRGYLQPKLMPLGYRPALIITGIIWGVWHAPLIAMGHNYGLDYAGHPWLGIIAMTWFTISVGIVFGWLSLRGKSVWPAVIAHAALNGIAGLPILFLSPEQEPNMLMGPTAVGLLGGLPWLALAVFLLIKGDTRPEEVSRETSRPSKKLPQNSAILAEGLSKSFGDLQAVQALDLDIPAGEVFGLLGPNGAGKTTSIRMLAALISPTAGQAWVAGHQLGEENSELRRAVGLLTEAPGLYTQLSAQRNLEFYAQMYEVEDIPSQVARYLRMLGLWDRRDAQAGTFSKGMRQKLAIARALLHEPKVLFLDEPTSGLDPEAAKIVREFIDELRQQGRTIILTTHNLDEADRLCDRIAVFNQRLLALDTPSNLRQRLYGREVKIEFSASGKPFAEALRQKDYVQAVIVDENQLSVMLDDPPKRNPELIRELVSLGADIRFVSEAKQSLESVYLDLINEGNEQGENNNE